MIFLHLFTLFHPMGKESRLPFQKLIPSISIKIPGAAGRRCGRRPAAAAERAPRPSSLARLKCNYSKGSLRGSQSLRKDRRGGGSDPSGVFLFLAFFLLLFFLLCFYIDAEEMEEMEETDKRWKREMGSIWKPSSPPAPLQLGSSPSKSKEE